MKAVRASLIGFALLLASSCTQRTPPIVISKPDITDTKPVGEGLKVVGYAMLGAAVVVTLGRALR